MFRYRYQIGFSDVDAAGLVYYPRYFHFCHLALEALFNEKSPIKYTELIYERRLGLPIVKVEAEYKKPLSFGETINIEFTIASIGRSSVVSYYRFLKNDGEDCFCAHITTVCTELDQKKSMAVPPDLRLFLSSFMVED